MGALKRLVRRIVIACCILFFGPHILLGNAFADVANNQIIADFLNDYSEFDVGRVRIIQDHSNSMDVIVYSKSKFESEHVCTMRSSAYRYFFAESRWKPLLENRRMMAIVERRDFCANLKVDSFFFVSGDIMTAALFERVVAALQRERQQFEKYLYLRDGGDLAESVVSITYNDAEGVVSAKLLSSGCELVVKLAIGPSGELSVYPYSSENVSCHHP